MENSGILLDIKNLFVRYNTDEGAVHAVNNLSLKIKKGETMGLVGETGAGKTTTALSILKILPEQVGEISSGEITYKGIDIVKADNGQMHSLRGKSISMIFQDPMTSLNPIISVGDQIMEMLDLHFKGMPEDEKNKKVDEILNMVGIPPERKTEYPFQFSGGMKQRIDIAMALICEPELLIADEPTTALDVTIQAQILELMKNLKKEFNSSMLMITHDLGIVAEICESVSIMYGGEIIESGSLEDIYGGTDNHPYTEGLFNCLPLFNSKAKRLTPIAGYPVNPMDLPRGCKFHDRCPKASERCKHEDPPVCIKIGHAVKCFLYQDWNEEGQNNGNKRTHCN
jgi:peptide/nickel transport system ATP-binding protein